MPPLPPRITHVTSYTQTTPFSLFFLLFVVLIVFTIHCHRSLIRQLFPELEMPPLPLSSSEKCNCQRTFLQQDIRLMKILNACAGLVVVGVAAFLLWVVITTQGGVVWVYYTPVVGENGNGTATAILNGTSTAMLNGNATRGLA